MERISVPEYEEIAGIYCSLAEECAAALRQFYADIEANCRKCSYKPMVDFTNQICRFYYGDFKSHLMRQFSVWEDSDYSLDGLTRKIGAGEDAAAVGKRYMEQIRDSLEGMFSGASLEEIHMDTSQPTIDHDLILSNGEYIKKFCSSARSALDEAVSRTRSEAEENGAFASIIGIVKTTGNSMIESFQEMLSQVDKGDELYGTGFKTFFNPATGDRGTAVNTSGQMNWPFQGAFL